MMATLPRGGVRISRSANTGGDVSVDVAINLYFFPVSIYFFWFQYQKALADGFLYWITIEAIISTAKGILWPFFLTHDIYVFVLG